MTCPVCNREIPAGSNICPQCGADLTKLRPARSARPAQERPERPMQGQPAQERPMQGRPMGRPSVRPAGRPPVQLNPQALIVAGGLFIVLLVLVVVLVRFMFGGASDPQQSLQGQGVTNQGTTVQGAVGQPQAQATFAVFGPTAAPQASTPQPVTPVPSTPTPAPTAEPTYVSLKNGDRNDQVKALQQALIALGYLEGDADGIFGKNTETAVKAFQKENGLTDDGIAGAQTQSALFRLYSATTAAQSATAPTADPNAEQAPNLPG